MASLERRADRFRLVFRFGGRRFSRSLRTKSDKAANACLARLEDNLRRVELGTLELPNGVDIASFLISDGRLNDRPKAKPAYSIEMLLDEYQSSVDGESLEQTTLDCIKIHVRHLKRAFPGPFQVQSLEFGHLQAYVDKRAKAKGRHGRSLSSTTIKKEIATFAAAWLWASNNGIVTAPFPKKGLRYPKTAEKPPFQTFDEIERKIKRGGLSEAEEADLWQGLFLAVPEIACLLQSVLTKCGDSLVYSMIAFAAHTGARRSEIIRAMWDDIDFHSKTITIHEKKRVRGVITTRRIPMSPFLADVLEKWSTQCAGGRPVFSHRVESSMEGCAKVASCPPSPAEMHAYLRRALADGKWEKVRGWHVFRHSFCSNCAAAGVDQRVINAWVGHQTEEMVRRYRHLFPDQQQLAIVSVFGRGQEPLVLNAS